MARPASGGYHFLMRYGLSIIPILAVLVLIEAPSAPAEPVNVAVASNFTDAARALAARFQRHSGQQVTLVFGSTGKHYAQILHGAPFAAFLAADSERPRRLEQTGTARPGSRFTYAIGRLVLWSPRAGFVDGRGRVLAEGHFKHLAVADPRLAPYGRAARQVLEHRGLWQTLQGRLVRGGNVGQAFQFVRSGNAELGLVALSQARRARRGSLWEPPQKEYDPIVQQAVLLRDDATARAFLAFLRSDEGRALIRSFGYGTPDAP